ncbi:SDR family NAD(P)-dependent oxidoreductase [Streptomyces sp. NPDC056638]|uniref:SDR family NAD(P)-dependent oxidoreductase n=1 Tax=Streptomyces sp. NPDC056638 TaxID=3345887 RepID=UPI00367BDE07
MGPDRTPAADPGLCPPAGGRPEKHPGGPQKRPRTWPSEDGRLRFVRTALSPRGRGVAEQPGARCVQLDVTDDASVEAAVKAIEAVGGLDVLVDNAGMQEEMGSHHRNHAHFLYVLGGIRGDSTAGSIGFDVVVPVQDHYRTHSQPRPRPLAGRAEDHLAVRYAGGKP